MSEADVVTGNCCKCAPRMMRRSQLQGSVKCQAKCQAPAKLQCPKCKELSMPFCASVFCSQECFKLAWARHKQLHKATAASWMYVLEGGKARALHMPNFAWTGSLRPHRVAPQRPVPDGITVPEWRHTGTPFQEMSSREQHIVPVRTAAQVEGVRKACKLGRRILDAAHAAVKPGVTTDDIDKVVHGMTVENGAYPSPLWYHNFPKSYCASVNEVVCHGIPDARPLQEGDIVNVDISCFLDGYHADLNETFCVGEVDAQSKHLIKTSYECLMKALKAVKPGMRYRDVGDIISTHAHNKKCSVIKTYCGHGTCELFHCAPNVPHYRKNKAKGIMEVNHTFTIEPMINAGDFRDVMWPDGWTSVTADGSRSAQFEHLVVVTEGGCEILTARTADSPPLWWEADGVPVDV